MNYTAEVEARRSLGLRPQTGHVWAAAMAGRRLRRLQPHEGGMTAAALSRKCLLLFVAYSAIHLWVSQTMGWLPESVDDVLYAAALLAGIPVILARRPSSRKLRKVQWFVVAYVLYCALTLVSGLTSGSTSGLLGIRDYLQFSVLPLYLFLLSPPPAEMRKTLRLFLGLFVLIALTAVVGTFVPNTGFQRIYTDAQNPTMMRVIGTVGTPNTLAILMVLASIVLLAMFLHSDTQSRWVLSGALLSLFAFAVIVSLSRSGVLMLPLMLLLEVVLYLCLCSGERFGTRGRMLLRLLRWTAVLLPAAVVAGFVMHYMEVDNLLLERVTTRLFATGSLIAARSDVWTYQLPEDIGERLLGHGVGAVSRTSAFAASSGERAVFDSYWLKVYLEQGLLGLVLFGFILFDIGARCWRLAFVRSTAVFGIAALVSVLFVAVSGVYTTVFDVYPVSVFVWYGFGCVLIVDGRIRVATPLRARLA